MTDGIITYEVLYDILRREKTRQEIQKLDDNFFDDIKKYIENKSSILKDLKTKSSIFAQKEIEKTEKELINIKKIVKDIYEKRESKITQLALSSAITWVPQIGQVISSPGFAKTSMGQICPSWNLGQLCKRQMSSGDWALAS